MKNEPMKIQFERSGGVAGMRMTTTVNTETLPAAEAQMLREMVDKAKFFDLRKFHTFFLKMGEIPIDRISEEMRRVKREENKIVR